VLFCLAVAVAILPTTSDPLDLGPSRPPVAALTEGIIAANVGIPIFGAFVFLCYRVGGSPWCRRHVTFPRRPSPRR